jgi:hypothetical protein
VEIIKKMVPKATLIDFHNCGSFHRLPLPKVSFFLLLFLCEKIRFCPTVVAPGSFIGDEHEHGQLRACPMSSSYRLLGSLAG